MNAIIIISLLASAKAYTLKEFLYRHVIPFKDFELGIDPEADALLAGLGNDISFPVVLFPDGTHLQDPELFELATRIGLHQKPQLPEYDLAIMGSGPAGLTAAIYAGSEGLKTVVIERHSPGGRAGSTSLIENLIAHPDGITGSEFTERSRRQAEKFGVEFVTPVELNQINIGDRAFHLSLSSHTSFKTKSLIVAVGVRYRMLEVPGIDRFVGTSIFYGSAMTEGRRNQDKEVFIVGGANSAGQAAMYFSRFARTVNLIVRGDSIHIRMSDYLVKEIENTTNIRIRTNSEIVSVNGTSHLESLDIKDLKTGTIATCPVHNLFLLIGGEPYTSCMAGKFLRDKNGFLITGADIESRPDFSELWKLERKPFSLETNIPGVFAAGDVRAGTAKRMAAAIGDGANAVTQASDYMAGFGGSHFGN